MVMPVKSVGVIGLGAIGRPMGRLVTEAGYICFGFDPSEEACAGATAVGVHCCASPAEVAQKSDFLIVVVGFEKQVEDVLFGSGGVLEGAPAGLIIGLSATVSPSYARGLAKRLADRDVRLLDMPTTRSHFAAEKGHLLVMGGGEPDVFEECRPVLAAFATDIFNLGAFGSGQVGKMVNNTILWACLAANDEGLRFGEELGVEQEKMREALVLSSAANFALIERADSHPIPWAEKDMVIAQQEADTLRFSMPLGGHVKELIKAFKVRKGYKTPTL
jgi:3-hydroxyisobutyrate dehydrogenase-like beta-hydroxyacid dehydrogenase